VYRPKDVTERLSISHSALRLWTTHFAPVLSPSAQASQTANGTPAQRRFTDEDLRYLTRAKQLLGDNKTYDEVLTALQAQPPPETLETTQETLPGGTGHSVGLVTETHPIIAAFEEALRAKDDTIQTLHLALTSKDKDLETLQATKDQVIASKDETIALLTAQLEKAQSAPQPTPVAPTRFRWAFLNRLFLDPVASVDGGKS
jgi:DNA-binding transcriptional MerR regulator